MSGEHVSGPELTARAESLEYSVIREMLELSGELDRDDLVHLEIGEPDFDTPEHIVTAAMDAAQRGETHYTSSQGTSELREAIAARAPSGVRYDPETEISVTTGGMEALYVAFQTVVDPGAEVIVPTPTWSNYLTQIRLADGVPVEVPLPKDESYALDPEQIADAITPDTAAVVLCSPSNPTGQVYERAAVEAVLDLAAEHDFAVIADEVYDRLVYGDQPTGIAGYTDHEEMVLTVNSCSKTYAMTGWRLGWLAGPERVIDAATKYHSYTSACPSSVSQAAALAALEGPQDPAEEMHDAFRNRREYVIERIAGLPYLSAPSPDGAIYAFLDVSALPGSSTEIARRLLREYGVVTAPGSGFGEAGEGALRLSFATSLDRLEIAFDRIESMVEAELD